MPIHFDIEWDDLQRIGEELGATDRQVKFALSRALRQTASRLRMLSSKGLRSELQLRAASALRKRLKAIKLRKGGAEGVQLWYGLNDMPVSWFKGTPQKTAAGATFRDKEFKGAFVGRSQYAKRKTIFKRAPGAARLSIEEQLVPVRDQAQTFVEDEIFVQLEQIFWPLFQRELAARVRYKIGEA
jgi:hypothetical protein